MVQQNKKPKEELKPSCGTPSHEQKPEEPSATPSTRQQTGRGLRVMKEKDVNEYMAKLLDEDSKVKLEGMEGEVLGNFKAVSAESSRVQQRLNSMRQEVERLTVAIQRFQGQLDAYANLLVAAEDARRASR